MIDIMEELLTGYRQNTGFKSHNSTNLFNVMEFKFHITCYNDNLIREL